MTACVPTLGLPLSDLERRRAGVPLIRARRVGAARNYHNAPFLSYKAAGVPPVGKAAQLSRL
jgi:hypothetical protein